MSVSSPLPSPSMLSPDVVADPLTVGAIADPLTGLTWENPPSEVRMNRYDAERYCLCLQTDGGGWRLPTVVEQRSFVRGCPATETGGTCNIGDADCNSSSCSNQSCVGCARGAGGADGCYWPDAAVGVCAPYWSSTSNGGDGGGSFAVDFDGASMGSEYDLLGVRPCPMRPVDVSGHGRLSRRASL